MPKFEVCPSPEMIQLYGDLSHKTVVVTDIFRATSCIVSGLATGVEHIIPVASLEECRELGTQGYLTAGERKGIKIDDFNFGNSPFQYMSEEASGQKVAMTTTNGTRAIDASRSAKEVLIGAFLNLQSVANELIKQQNDIIIFCAGWRGKLSMEDTLFAGALAQKLTEAGFNGLNDGVFTAQQLWNIAQQDLHQFLLQASHAQRLIGMNAEKDIEFCTRIDEFDVLPTLDGKKLVKKY